MLHARKISTHLSCFLLLERFVEISSCFESVKRALLFFDRADVHSIKHRTRLIFFQLKHIQVTAAAVHMLENCNTMF